MLYENDILRGGMRQLEYVDGYDFLKWENNNQLDIIEVIPNIFLNYSKSSDSYRIRYNTE
jgi:hypothetical protein